MVSHANWIPEKERNCRPFYLLGNFHQGSLHKKHLIAVFLDLEKAYDTTWKDCIMRDLYDLGLRERLPIFIKNFLFKRTFRVHVGSTLSDLQNQEVGVPQGSILSITLFSIKINNIVKRLNPSIDWALYVDNFVIYYQATYMNIVEQQLQLNKINKWATDNGFKFSKSKTQYVHFLLFEENVQRPCYQNQRFCNNSR